MSKIGILLDQDHMVAHWTWQTWQLTPMPVNWAMGLVRDGYLVGSALFQWYNGNNIELNYYGPGTATVGVAKVLARVALKRFNVQRVTLRTENTNLAIIRGMMKFGFRLEGMERRFYGRDRHAVRLVMFREEIEKIARL
jgi:RimJ/RimL family protein N-acetyltransferase